MPHRRRTRWRHWLLVAAGFTLLAALFARIGPGKIGELLFALGPNFAVIVGLFGCHEWVRCLATARCFPPDRRPSVRSLLRARFTGELAGTLTRTGPFVAEPARAWALASQEGVAGGDAYAAAIGELVVNSCMSSAVTMAAIGTAWALGDIPGSVRLLADILLWSSAGHVLLVAAAVATRTHVAETMARAARWLPIVNRRVTVDLAPLRRVEDRVHDAIAGRHSAFATVASLEFLAQIILVTEVCLAIRAMGVPISIWHGLQVEVFAKSANIIQFVGATEAGYALLFERLGLTSAVGFTLALVKLLRSLVTGAIGLMVVSQLERILLSPSAEPR